MFYETKVIDGILHDRTEPDGEWHQCTLEEITQKLIDSRTRFDLLAEELRNSNEKIENAKLALAYDC